MSLRSIFKIFAESEVGVKCSYDRVGCEVDKCHRSTISRRNANHLDRCFFATGVVDSNLFILLFRVACDLDHACRDNYVVAFVGFESDCTTEVDFDHLSLTCLNVNLVGSLNFVAFRVINSYR